METVLSDGFNTRAIGAPSGVGVGVGIVIGIVIALFALACEFPGIARAADSSEFVCEQGATLASGRPDPDLFASGASKDVRAFWCERYDANGNSKRAGPYWEIYSNGRTRTRANYVDSQLTGPVSIRNDDGSRFLRGFLEAGEWSGTLEIFHENGAVWFEAHFESGRLDGALRTHFPDGALESETRYQEGREDGLARSFYPTAAGGRLKSEAHVEADRLVGRHRLLDPEGELMRSIDWDLGPAAWRGVHAKPAAPDPAPSPARPTRAGFDPERDLRD